MKNKKGLEINQVIGGVFIFFVLAVMVVTFAFTLTGLQTSFFTSGASGTVTNESSVIGVNEAGFDLYARRDQVCTVTQCVNSTSGTVILAPNRTVSNCHVAYSGSDDLKGFNNSLWKCSYTYTWTADTAASNNSASFATTIVNSIPILGILLLLILVSVIIGVIVYSVLGKGKM